MFKKNSSDFHLKIFYLQQLIWRNLAAISNMIISYGYVGYLITFYTTIAIIIYGSINTIAYNLLIVGVYKKRSSIMIPGLVINGFGIVIGLAFQILITVYVVQSLIGVMVYIPILLILTTLCIYFWFVIYSHYEELKKNSNKMKAELSPISAYNSEIQFV